MPQFAYPFDPHADNDNNIVKAEQHVLSQDMPSYRVILPTFAPFFETNDLIITCNDKPLLNGFDYYLSHRYFRGVERTGRLMYGGIWIINPKLSGTFKVSYRTLGGKFTSPRSVLDDYLTNRLTDPSTASWEEVIDDDPFFPPVDIKFDRAGFKDEADVQASIREVASVIENKDQTESDIYRMMDDWFNQLKKIVDDSTLTTHKLDKNNPHDELWHESDALKVDGISQDSTKAFGRTINDLATYVNDRGITQSDLDQYVERSGDNVVVGDIVLKDGVMSLGFTKDNAVTRWANINLSNGNVSFTAISDGIVHADKDKNSPGTRAALESGNVSLSVTSRGATKTDDDLRINDKVVIHDGNLEDHIPTTGTNVIDIETKNSDDLSFSGKGVTGDPLKADVTLNDASESTYGVAVGSIDINDTSTTKVAFSEASYLIDEMVQSKVPNSIKINDVTLSNDIVLNASNFGLDKVANLSDIDMPVVTEHYTILAGKATLEHTHTFDELGIDRATSSVYGVTYIDDDPSSTATDRGFSASKLFDLDSEVYQLEAKANNSLPDDVIDISQYGGNHWLPVPVQGSYEGSGHYQGARTMSGYVEPDGKLIIYRNGYDLEQLGVYYAYATFLNDSSLVDYVATATRYRPGNLPEGWEVRYSYRCSRTAMGVRLLDPTGKEHVGVVLFNNSGNGAAHKVCVIQYDGDIREMIPFVHNNEVYLINTWVGDGFGIQQALKKCSIVEFDSFKTVKFTSITISGNDYFGHPVTGEQVKLVAKDWSDDPNEECICIRTNSDFTIYVKWNNLGMATAIEGNKLRLFVVVGTYEPSAYTSKRGQWAYSVVFDLDNNTFEIDPGNELPYTFDGISYTGPAVAWGSRGMTNKSGNVGTGEFTDGNLTAVFATYNEATPGFRGQSTSAVSYYESLKASTRDIKAEGAHYSLVGNFGSTVGVMQRHIAFLPNETLHAWSGHNVCKYVPDYTYKSGVKGFGPTTDRVIDTDWMRLRHNVLYTDGSMSKVWGGILHKGRLTSFTDMGDDLTVTGSVSTTNAELDNLMDQIKAYAILNINDNDTYGGGYVSVYVLPDPRISPMFVSCIYGKRDNNANVTYLHMGLLEEVSRDGDVGTLTIKSTLHFSNVNGRYGSVESPRDWSPNSGVFEDNESGKLCMVLNTNPTYYGSSHIPSIILEIDAVTSDVDFKINSGIYSYRASGFGITKEYGLMWLTQHDSFTGIFGNVVGKTAADWKLYFDNTSYSKERVILHTSQVAEGWQIYFTQEIPFFIGSTAHSIPETTLDLQSLYPSTHKSNKFYIYATVVGGTAHYELSEQYVVDSSTAIYIGVCETDETQITNLQVNRATRLGEFREFTEHLTDSKPHGLDLSQVTTDDVGLGLLENKSIRNTLVVPTFKEVFNGWYRSSHLNEKPYPAIPAEINAWTFDEATDSIRNTTNSSSLVGMISPEDNEVGDYDFITGVSSNNADDDGIGVIFAMVVKDGIEHTLSAVCSGTDSRTSHFAVTYNLYQSNRGLKTLFTHSTTLKHGWDEIPERIISVKRRGDIFTVHVTAMMTDADSEQTFEFDVKDYPELSIFRGAVRFGYCAWSQASSTWRNILRPDEDGKNFYASQKLYRDNFSWSNRIKSVSGSITHTATVGSELYFDIPIPTDLQGFNLQAWGSLAYSRDSSGGIASASLVGERTGNIVRFKHPTPGVGFSSPKIDYNITFFTDVRMI